MSSGLTLRRSSAPYISVIALGIAFAVVEILIIEYGISYREVIVTLMVLAAFAAFAAGKRGLKLGFVFLVLTFAVGYRTVNVTPDLRVHPSELVLWGLLALPLVQRNKVIVWLPLWLVLFIPFWLWGWWPFLTGDFKWEPMFSEFKNFMILIPLFLIAGSVLMEKSSWRVVLPAFYFVGAWIAAMGTLEYVYPGVKTIFPEFVTLALPIETGEGFQRARFSFWGSTDAVYLCVLAMPIAAACWLVGDGLASLPAVPTALVVGIIGLAALVVGLRTTRSGLTERDRQVVLNTVPRGLAPATAVLLRFLTHR